MLYDKDFLLKLDKNKNKVIYAKIIALDYNENPIETVEGRVSSGSINIDGNSAVRRTCSLTMVANEFNYDNYYWGLNTKFKLEIGVKNTIDSNYPKIIWFKQGVYLITSLNISHSATNFTLNIQGKDKMCLLNGEISGNITAPTDFGSYEVEISKNVWEKKKIPIYDIIRNMIHEYAREPYERIIINDLNDLAIELLEYRYDTPMYLYRGKDSLSYTNATLNGDKACTTFQGNITFKELTEELESLSHLVDNDSKKIVTIDGDAYYVTKIEFGQTAGYRITDLVYAGDLIAQVGNSITSVLDKIKNMLGEFEYFYDLDGRFVFQKKKSFIDSIPMFLKNNKKDEYYMESLALSSSNNYYFSGGELITSISNQPNLKDMKNDYSIWGKRKNASGVEIPIHLRYAIDIKPTYYHATSSDLSWSINDWDWREILYQMAIDYFQHHEEENFCLNLAKNNPMYPTGITGYEQYYTDMEGFWRQLYCPAKERNENNREEYYNVNSDYRDNWNKNVFNSPEKLNFWIDFLDAPGELSQFNVKTVGARTKTINDSQIKAIYFRETPQVIFIESKKEDTKESVPINTSGYRCISVGAIEQMFSISAQGKSAEMVLHEKLYKHAYCAETISINCIPIYYLEPNTRIHISDLKTKLDNDYIINRITIPLVYNGTMTISAIKAVENII